MKRLRRLSASSLLVSLAATVLVLAPTPSALAHGNCGPAAVWERDGSYVTSWIDHGGPYVKGQTHFYCTGGEEHKRIVVDVFLYRCEKDSAASCGGPWNRVDSGSNTCRTAVQCQKTITVSCRNGYLYTAYGRWAAYNDSGTRVHQSRNYPDIMRQEPSYLGGSPSIGC